MPRPASCSTPTRSVSRTAMSSSASRPIAAGTSQSSRSRTRRCARSASLAAAAPAHSTCRRPAICSMRMPADSWPCRSTRPQGRGPDRRCRSSSARRSTRREARRSRYPPRGRSSTFRARRRCPRAHWCWWTAPDGRRSCPTRGPRTRILGCRPTVAASQSPSNRTTAPTSGSTISSAAPRRRS